VGIFGLMGALLKWLTGKHTCDCGAVYRVTTTRKPFPGTGTAICEVCCGLMDSWRQSISFHSYVLIKPPRKAIDGNPPQTPRGFQPSG
jgi:hypothetical protein